MTYRELFKQLCDVCDAMEEQVRQLPPSATHEELDVLLDQLGEAIDLLFTLEMDDRDHDLWTQDGGVVEPPL